MVNFYLKEKTLNANNKSFKYIEKGEGNLVLLVHGWPESCHSWLNQIFFISNLGFKVVAINVRGYADSYSPQYIQSYKLKFFMEDIIDIINYFNKKMPILIGHDWGAPICWTTAYYKKKITAVIGLSVPFTEEEKYLVLNYGKNYIKIYFFIKIIFNMKIYLKKN